jgi:hypothetical protein
MERIFLIVKPNCFNRWFDPEIAEDEIRNIEKVYTINWKTVPTGEFLTFSAEGDLALKANGIDLRKSYPIPKFRCSVSPQGRIYNIKITEMFGQNGLSEIKKAVLEEMGYSEDKTKDEVLALANLIIPRFQSEKLGIDDSIPIIIHTNASCN